MTSTVHWLKKGAASLFNSSTPSLCSNENDTDTCTPATTTPAEFSTAPSATSLFTRTDPAVDGEECLHDCSSCTVQYPRKFDVDMTDKLYGNVGAWDTHLLVATGKTDWVRDVADERGSLMEAVERGGALEDFDGKLKLSASNIPVPDEYHDHEPGEQPTTVLILPAFKIVERVTPALAPDLIKYFVNPSVTTTTPLSCQRGVPPLSDASSDASDDPPHTPHHHQDEQQLQQQKPALDMALTLLTSRPSPHAAVILLCSQRTRDVRCGQSAPLLRREFERHLRPLGLYRELDDERPGGVGIYFVSHVGGHKYAANVIVYRRRDFGWYKQADEDGESNPDPVHDKDEGKQQGGGDDEGAAQGIWLARVRPEDCENIIRYTVLQGKVVKPGHQLRGGFDREKGLISW